MKQEKFIVEEVQEISDRTSHSVSTSTSPSVKNKRELRADENVTPNVVVVPETRRRFSAQEKQELVRLTYLSDNSVSTVARTYGIAPSVLFRWQSLEKQGQLTALKHRIGSSIRSGSGGN